MPVTPEQEGYRTHIESTLDKLQAQSDQQFVKVGWCKLKAV